MGHLIIAYIFTQSNYQRTFNPVNRSALFSSSSKYLLYRSVNLCRSHRWFVWYSSSSKKATPRRLYTWDTSSLCFFTQFYKIPYAESKSITISNHFTKAAFKTKIAYYRLVDRVTGMFSCVVSLLSCIILSLSSIIACTHPLSWNFGWTQNRRFFTNGTLS